MILCILHTARMWYSLFKCCKTLNQGILRLNIVLPLSTNFRNLNHKMMFYYFIARKTFFKRHWNCSSSIFYDSIMLIFQLFNYIGHLTSIFHFVGSLDYQSMFIYSYSSLDVVTLKNLWRNIKNLQSVLLPR